MTEQYVDSNQSFVPDARPLSVLAVMSLVLGILFLCLGPLAFFPLGFGIFAITRTGSNGPKRGLGLAIAGTSLGGVGVLGTCLSAGIFLPALGAARLTAQKIVSASNIRLIVDGAVVYADDHNGQFPTQAQWPDVLIENGLIEADSLVSPAEDGDGISYIYLSGESTNDMFQIVVYEDTKHFTDGVNVGFADGHVEMVDHTVFEEMLAEQLADQPSP